MTRHVPVIAAFVAWLSFCGVLHAEDVDLTRAVVVTPNGLSPRETQAVKLLTEEIARRSWVRWETASALPSSGPAIVVVPSSLKDKAVPIPAGVVGPEGFRIGIVDKTVYVSGNDERGTLFGVGRLLRELRIERERITLPGTFSIVTTPHAKIRGHQLGYRPKTNSYDGWTVAMWEQYIRDLIVFGCNGIELIPPRSDDDVDSPLFPEPPLRVMQAVSKIADSYGIDVWVWYPAMDADYSNPQTVAKALKEWGEVFRALPRVDKVFVPGGDPGHTPPKVLFPFLEKQTANLKAIHPKAEMWMSPQSFTGPHTDDFFALMKQEPKWLSGIVHGPQVRVPMAVLRERLPRKYPIRDYPDITHSRTCQYPVKDWDLAFALTIGREGCNPRPNQMAAIYKHTQAHTEGFITYSEGCHDDVNKIVWSSLGWDERADLHETLKQYGRYFIGPKLGEKFGEAQFALERNWVGPILKNAGIDETLAMFQSIERAAGPSEKLNWRFQQALYRAYYDAYVKARVNHEVGATYAARLALKNVDSSSSLKAVTEATAILDRAEKQPPAPALRVRIGELAEALFQSARIQLSVEKYHAIGPYRGASLDTLATPLSDSRWLRAEMKKAISTGGDENGRRGKLLEIVNRTNPGPGGFYDDLGNPAKSPHLVRAAKWENDPGYYITPANAYGRGQPPLDFPREWWDYTQCHYDTPLKLHYEGLDRSGQYRVRVVYAGVEVRKIRLTANDREIHGLITKPYEPLEFDIPAEVTAKGDLTLTWTQETGTGGTGRGCQVCEVWILKEQKKK
ncbi:MAG: hypothetical protein U0798_14490 [Gemmataceae bacterium]